MRVKKTYFADIESFRSVFLLAGFVITLSAVYFAFEYESLPPDNNITFNQSNSQPDEEIIPITKQEEKKVLPPSTVPKSIDILRIVENDLELEEELEIENTEIDMDMEVAYDATYSNEIKTEEEVDEEPVFMIVEEMPIFRPDICKTASEGNVELYRYVMANLSYPVSAMESGISGRVFVEFIVDVKGKVQNVSVLRGVHPALDREAIRVVSNLPDFSPGRQVGRAVKVRYTVPINFVLK